MNYEQFDAFVEDLLSEQNPRSIIIIGASKIDDLLYRILCKFLLPKSSKPRLNDELLDGDNPLSTFSARIKMAYRLGIIDDDLFRILERIRSIRNKSAHEIEFQISRSPLREHYSEVKKIILNRNSFIRTQERYFKKILENDTKELQCIIITICVLLEAIYEQIEQTLGIDTTLSISKK